MINYATLGSLITPAKVIRCGNDSFPVLSMTMHNGIVMQSERFKKKLASADQSDYKVVKRGQLVVGFPIDEGVLYVQKAADEGIMSPAYNVWDIDSKVIDPDFLELCLHSPQSMQYYKNKLRGTTARRRSIPVSDLEALKIRLPDMQTQHEIVAIIKKAEAIIVDRQEQLDYFEQLVKSRFVELFGNFVYERGRWSICEIGDVADTIDPQPSHRTPPVSSDGIPYIGIAECNYKTLQIDFANARKVGRDVLQEHLNRYMLDKGDFIIGKIGTIGKPFFLPVKQTYTLSANTVLIKPNKLRVEPQYLFAVFQSEYMERIIDAEKKSTSQPAFGIQKVRKINIPMPPLELQQQFAAFVEQVEKSKYCSQKFEELCRELIKIYEQEWI